MPPLYRKLERFAFGTAAFSLSVFGIAAGGDPTVIVPAGLAALVLVGGWRLREYLALRERIVEGRDDDSK
jgi:hypothetical protein